MSLHLIILILHVLGAGLVLGVVFLSVFLTLKPLNPEKLGHLGFIGRFGMWGSIWQLLTGLILTANDWEELGEKPIFWVKMGLYVVEGTLASMVIDRQAKRAVGGQPAKGLGTTLLLQAVLIIGIIALGVLLVGDAGE